MSTASQQSGGARPGGKRRWQTLSHNGVQLPPKTPDTQHSVSVRIRSGLVGVPRGPAASALIDYLRRGGTDSSFMGKAAYARNFLQDWRELLPPTGALTRAADSRDIDLSGSVVVMHSTGKEPGGTDVRYSTATVDGKRTVPIAPWSVDRPGVFVGKTKHADLTGRIRRRIGAADVTINIGVGQRPPKPPPGERWGAIVHMPYVDWVASWRDPVTNVIKYARFAPSSISEQDASRARFDIASAFYRANLQPMRTRLARTLRRTRTHDGTKQTSLCAWLIVELGLRVGSGGHNGQSAAGGSYGASTLLRRHVIVQPGGVRLDFPAKDGVRYVRTLSTTDHPDAVRAFRALVSLGGSGGARAPLFPDIASSETINALFDEGISAKVVRTARASALFEATLDRLLKGVYPHTSKKSAQLAFAIANARVALFCNHRRAQKAPAVDLTEYERRLDAIVDAGLEATSAAELARDTIRPAALILTTSRTSYIDPRIEYAVRARLPPASRPPLSAAAKAATWAAGVSATHRFRSV